MPEIIKLGGVPSSESLSNLNFDEQTYIASDFSFDGTLSRVTLPQAPNPDADLHDAFSLHRNGIKDHKRVAAPPASSREFQVTSSELLIFGDVTLIAPDEYKVFYAYTEAP